MPADDPNVFYVYVLFDWCGIPRYVGKGKGERWINHERTTDRNNQQKNEFIEQTWVMLGEVPKIKIKDKISKEEAYQIEIALIKALGRIDLGTGPLVNMTDGGDGSNNISERTSKLLSKAARSFWLNLSQEERESFVRLRNSRINHEKRRETLKKMWAGKTEDQLRDHGIIMGNIRREAWSKLTAEERKNLVSTYKKRDPHVILAVNRAASDAAKLKYWSLTQDEREQIIQNRSKRNSDAWRMKSEEEKIVILKKRGESISKAKQRLRKDRPLKYCKCGCGRVIRQSSTYSVGHYPRN